MSKNPNSHEKDGEDQIPFSMNQKKEKNNLENTLALGLCLGVTFGIIFNQLALGISLGLCLCVSLGSFKQKNKK